MRLHQSIRRARIFTAAAAIVFTSVSAFAQNGQPSFSTALQAAAQGALQQQPSSESVRRLSMDEAVKLALEQNLGIRIQRLDPQISDVGVMQARSFWAPNLTSTFSRNAQTQQPTNALAGGATNILNANVQTNLGMNQFKTVVDCDSVRDLSDSLFNRPGAHCGLRKSTRPKEKVGANPPDETAVLRASCELYGKD